MAMTENEKNKMAVLIDSENVSSKNNERIHSPRFSYY